MHILILNRAAGETDPQRIRGGRGFGGASLLQLGSQLTLIIWFGFHNEELRNPVPSIFPYLLAHFLSLYPQHTQKVMRYNSGCCLLSICIVVCLPNQKVCLFFFSPGHDTKGCRPHGRIHYELRESWDTVTCAGERRGGE